VIDPQVLAFTAVVALLTISPGADTLLVIRNVLSRGPRAGVLTTTGISAGVMIHASLSAVGLSLILVRSAALFQTVKYAGAAYLIYLGVRSILASRRSARPEAPDMEPGLAATVLPGRETGRRQLFRPVMEGFLTNLLNPKVAVFYLAFLPQFIQPGDPVLVKSLLLASIHIGLGYIWLTLVSIFTGRLRLLLTRPAVRRGFEAITGGILVAFGIRLALERR
jgi:threonine/homoserine/homoserine lactone efflux protein